MPWPFPWQHFLGRKPRDDDARLEMSKNSPGPRSFSSFSKLADDWWAQNPTSWGNCSSKWQVRRYHLMYSQSAHVHSLVQPQPTDNFFFLGKSRQHILSSLGPRGTGAKDQAPRTFLFCLSTEITLHGDQLTWLKWLKQGDATAFLSAQTTRGGVIFKVAHLSKWQKHFYPSNRTSGEPNAQCWPQHSYMHQWHLLQHSLPWLWLLGHLAQHLPPASRRLRPWLRASSPTSCSPTALWENAPRSRKNLLLR